MRLLYYILFDIKTNSKHVPEAALQQCPSLSLCPSCFRRHACSLVPKYSAPVVSSQIDILTPALSENAVLHSTALTTHIVAILSGSARAESVIVAEGM